jgi:N-acetylglutamate synthase-like GNAT family acetyltransferase
MKSAWEVVDTKTMKHEIIRDGRVAPEEIENLREAVGWDRCEGTYSSILKRHYTYYIVRAEEGRLIGYMSILSDGISDAFLLDLMVHPDVKGEQIGTQLVKRGIQDMKDAGIRCVQVTFDESLRDFYARCGFHIFGGGVVDFKTMDWNAERQQ